MEIKFDYPDLAENEKVYLVLHRHWVALVKIAGAIIVMTVLPILGIIFPSLFGDLDISIQIYAIAGGIYYLILLAVLMTSWIDYFHDVFIITDCRIINIEQSGLFGYKTSELLFGQIIDITADKDGFLAMMLEYGTLSIKTAAHNPDFCLRLIPNPQEVSRQIKNVLAMHKSYKGPVESGEGVQRDFSKS